MARESKEIEIKSENAGDINESNGILKLSEGSDVITYIFNKNIFETIPNNGEIEQEIDDHGIEHHYTNSCLWISIRDFLNNIYYTGEEKKIYTVSELRKMAGFIYPDDTLFDANEDHAKYLIKLLNMLNLCVCIFKPQMINKDEKDIKVSTYDEATFDLRTVTDTQKPHPYNVIGPNTSYCFEEGRQIIPILNSGGVHFCVITNMPIKISAKSRDSSLSKFTYISNNYFTFENASRYNYKGTKLNSESLSAEDKSVTTMTNEEINKMFEKQEIDNIINRYDRLRTGREKYMASNPGKKILETEQVQKFLILDVEFILSSTIAESEKGKFLKDYVKVGDPINLKMIEAIYKIDPAIEHYNDMVDAVILSFKTGGFKFKHKYLKYIHKISQL